ncbi:ispH [Symbiodinium sp. CCMP2592]|nr:ispH [Symbiodinium sp. CCMP2592]
MADLANLGGPAFVALPSSTATSLRATGHSGHSSPSSSASQGPRAAAAATVAGLAALASQGPRRSRRTALKAATELPTVDRATTKQWRRDLMRSDQYYKFGRTQMENAMNQLQEVSGSELLTKIRQNGFRLTVGDITFVLAESYGFCWGVERAVAMAYEARDFFPDKNIWVTNEIIHNPSVNQNLSDKGMRFVETTKDGGKDYSDVEEGDVVILPAFGASVDEMALLKERNVQIVDTTCPWVSKVWASVERSKDKDHTAIIHGKYDHEETVATKSFASKYIVLKNMAEAEYVAAYVLGEGNKEEFMAKFSKAMSPGFDPDVDLDRVGVANQTTMLKGETELIGKLFERTLIKKYGPQNINEHFMSFNTICDATQERQDAMYKMFGAEYEASPTLPASSDEAMMGMQDCSLALSRRNEDCEAEPAMIYLVRLIVHPVLSESHSSTSYCLPGILGVCRTTCVACCPAAVKHQRLQTLLAHTAASRLPRDLDAHSRLVSLRRNVQSLCASPGGWLRGRLCVFYLLHSRFSKGPPSSATQAIMLPDMAIMSEPW